MTIKTLGLSQLIYSASNLVVPAGIEDTVKTKCFKFLWKNKKDKIKRSGLYQDTSKGGLRMIDVGLRFKSLNLAWIPRLLATGKRSWYTVANYFFRKMGGLDFILGCNYNAKYFNQPTSSLGSSRFSIWRRLGRRPWHTADHVTKISNDDGDLFKMAATAKRVRRSGYEIWLR